MTNAEPAETQPAAKKLSWLKHHPFKKAALQYLIACNAEMISNLFEAIVRTSVKAINHILELL